MPLVVFTINTGVESIVDTVALGMERDGGFTLRHEFDMPPHEDTEYTLKHFFVNVSGDGRNTGLETRGENKKPTMMVDVIFPDLNRNLIVSRRHSYSKNPTPTQADETAINRGSVNVELGQIRFPITQFPVNGGGSNVVDRNGNNTRASHYEFRGTHVCDIPLGKMKLTDNTLTCKLYPRDRSSRTFVDTIGSDRIVRIRNLQVVLEYK